MPYMLAGASFFFHRFTPFMFSGRAVDGVCLWLVLWHVMSFNQKLALIWRIVNAWRPKWTQSSSEPRINMFVASTCQMSAFSWLTHWPHVAKINSEFLCSKVYSLNHPSKGHLIELILSYWGCHCNNKPHYQSLWLWLYSKHCYCGFLVSWKTLGRANLCKVLLQLAGESHRVWRIFGEL